jgi:transposase
VKNKDNETKTNYVWLFRSSITSNKQITFFFYNDGRKYHTVQEFFNNPSSQIKYIIADGYGVYDKIPGYKLVSCMVHARRKFIDVTNSVDNKSSQKYKIAMQFINKIKTIYQCEDKYQKEG